MRKMRFVIVEVLFLCILMHKHGCDPLCVPCEEHKQCRILFEYQSDGSEVSYLIWKLDGIEKAICYATGKMECSPYPKTEENLKFWYGEAGNITTEVIVSNATRIGDTKTLEKRWELFAYNKDGSSKVTYTCDFKMYTKVKDPVCNHEASEKGLRLTCIVSPGYPKRACVFNFNLDRNSSIHFSTVYSHTELSKDPLMYKTECYVDIPIESLITGRLDYNITIGPDLNNGTILKTGLSIQRNITIEKPKVSLVNCKDTVEEGKYVHCVCTREDNSDIKTLIYWDTNSSDEKHFRRSALLEILQTKIVNYTCIAKNDLGWTTFIEYSPTLKELTTEQQACPREKPHNCSTACYSDNEFCLNGQVYLFLPANISILQDWCENQTIPIEGMQSDPYKDACKHLLNPPGVITNLEEITIISIIVCTTCIALCVLCYFIWRFGKRESPDDSASFSKQPKEIVPFKISIDEDCIEMEKHMNFISCSTFSNNSAHYLKTFSVFNKIDTSKKFILRTIDLIVKLTVGYVSKNRPHNDSLREQRGKSFTFTGTGRVVKVNKSNKPCHCPKHMSQGGCFKGTVDIATTTHVVFDEEEAKCTTVELFDDEDKSGARIKSLQGEWFHETDQAGECVVQCETCDEDLCEKLTSALTEQRELSKHLPFNNDTFFVVSHPHGKSKHISFGRRSQVKDCSDVTCPGCYGASVLMLHSESSSVHFGVNGKDRGFRTTGPPEKVPLL